ncbi:hypothetical protein ACOMHN_047830 [Nucella lapillus]
MMWRPYARPVLTAVVMVALSIPPLQAFHPHSLPGQARASEAEGLTLDITHDIRVPITTKAKVPDDDEQFFEYIARKKQKKGRGKKFGVKKHRQKQGIAVQSDYWTNGIVPYVFDSAIRSVSPCSDTGTDCSTLAPSQCLQDPDNMFQQCSKSCGYCVDDACTTNNTIKRLCPHGCDLCVRTHVKCAPPNPPVDAASGYSLKAKYDEGENVSFTCKDNANLTRLTSCLNGGQWSPLGYVCRARCGPPSPPADAASGYSLRTEYSDGENVSFTCQSNTNLNRLTTCLSNEQWSALGYVCGGCPEGWTFHDNLCILESTTAMTYDNASAHCLSLQAQVAEARTQEDIDFLIQLKNNSHSQWMALRKDPELCSIWADRTQPSWTKWDSLASPTKHCTMVLPNRHWSTSDCCSSQHLFVCQRPAFVSSVCADYLPDCTARVQVSQSLCQDDPDFAKFSCPRTCYGPTCQDPCASSPCLNGGKCYVRGGTFHCVCSKNYNGTRCENQTGPVSPCSDTGTDCSTLAPSQCLQDPDNMFQQCSKSCGYCVDGPTCVDRSDQCGAWITANACTTNNTVKRLCPHGCDLCFNPDCYDKIESCGWRGYIGECQRNPVFMTANCPYTCHACTVPSGCSSQPCKNGGTCSENSEATDGFTCDCSGSGFEGPTCEQPASQCAEGWRLHEGFCYQFISKYNTFTDAEASCSDSMAEADVTTALTTSENDLIYNVSGNKAVWIHARRPSSGAGFQWPDGSLVSAGTYQNWAPNEPDGEYNSYTEVMCAFQRSKDSEWKDIPCHLKRMCVCKYTAI